uniref:Uncharacterized protein n=1 Tax=Romanomermis culicivorax TaxID=13658 RepID=A0A915HMR6_ROMCU
MIFNDLKHKQARLRKTSVTKSITGSFDASGPIFAIYMHGFIIQTEKYWRFRESNLNLGGGYRVDKVGGGDPDIWTYVTSKMFNVDLPERFLVINLVCSMKIDFKG